MPIYEYQCDKCESEFEAEQRITDDPLKTCPRCRSRKVKRLISQTSFVLKGSGWYSDLYSSPKASDAKPPSGADADDSKKDSPSSESKSEPKDKGKDKAKGKGKSKGGKAAA
jgi:putative FmdB family regulatory protein